MAREEHQSDDLGPLMRSAQDGDRDAYRDLLRAIVPILRRKIGSRFPFLPRRDVEDLIQDILLAVHAARATYDPARPFLPWLFAIARNRTADMARRHARRSAREIAVETYPETSGEAETNTGEAAYGDAEALRQAMKSLPRSQRVAIELLKLRELSLKEAASMSGMSVNALKVATHRATRALRLMLRSNETAK
ncbi:MAG TPA: sigma-70 family RNA polymerase sigma factor [Bauldia sp.]|nr:sigma-70 family RNA polymerase sigma factor [Bauldia sp.]